MPAPEPKLGPSPARAAAGWLGGYLAFRLLAGAVMLPVEAPAGLGLAAAAAAALGAIGLPIAGLAALARHRARPLLLLLFAALGLSAWLGLATLAPGGAFGLPAAAARDAGKIVAAGCLGLALAAGVREPNILFPAGLFAAFADVVVVRFGTVQHALSTEQGQAVLRAVSADVPSMQAGLPPLTIGPADFLFLGAFLACAARFDMDLRRTAWVMAVVLAASLLLVPVVGAVPALAPMTLAFLVVNFRSFRLSSQELWGSLVVLVAAGGLFLAYFLVGYGR